MPLLTLDAISKAYPGTIANNGINLQIEAGEIHALIGENGAGKSTCVKMIYGLVKPDSGRMYFNGKPYAPQSPNAARREGVAMVFQHFSLFDALTVQENIALGLDRASQRRNLNNKIKEISGNYGLAINPKQILSELSAGERQRVEIIRCLLLNPKLLIMDEPTSVLTTQEAERLFQTLRQLAKNGMSILYISHKLEEIRGLCQSATILRHGHVVAKTDPRQESIASLAKLMIGRDLGNIDQKTTPRGNIALSLKNISLKSNNNGIDIKNITLELYEGEILGIGGIAGNGQSEFQRLLSGEAQANSGQMTYFGQNIAGLNPSERRLQGFHTVPEDRYGHAADPEQSLILNTLITAKEKRNLTKAGFIDYESAESYARLVIDGFDVRTPSPHSKASALSGGNLQKFIIGREILQIPRLLVVNQPSWGVDASAANFIRQRLIELAKKGTAILVISQDIDELLEISNRFAALADGCLSEPVATNALNIETIGLMLGGETRKITHAV